MENNKKVSAESDAHELACGIFLCDDGKSPVEQYEKLEKAMKSGNGNDDAVNHACVWKPVQLFAVTSVINQVNGLREQILELLENHSK